MSHLTPLDAQLEMSSSEFELSDETQQQSFNSLLVCSVTHSDLLVTLTGCTVDGAEVQRDVIGVCCACVCVCYARV